MKRYEADEQNARNEMNGRGRNEALANGKFARWTDEFTMNWMKNR